jgi:hypothetical protein
MLRCARGEEGGILSLFKELMMKRRCRVLRRSRVVRRSVMVRRRRMLGRGPMRRRRRLSLSVCQGRLRGATWLLLLLCPNGRRIGF